MILVSELGAALEIAEGQMQVMISRAEMGYVIVMLALVVASVALAGARIEAGFSETQRNPDWAKRHCVEEVAAEMGPGRFLWIRWRTAFFCSQVTLCFLDLGSLCLD